MGSFCLSSQQSQIQQKYQFEGKDISYHELAEESAQEKQLDSTKNQRISIQKRFLKDHPLQQKTIQFEDGSFYEGQVIGVIPNGKGKEYFKTGEFYEGEFYDGKKEGQGAFHFADGCKFQGQFLNNVMNGKGKYTFDNGDIYEGEFKDNQKHGTGIYYHKQSKERFEGQYRNGLKNGNGKFYTQNKIIEGVWVNSVLQFSTKDIVFN